MGCTLALHELALQRSICAECHAETLKANSPHSPAQCSAKALLLWRGIDTLPRTGFGQSFYALPEWPVQTGLLCHDVDRPAGAS